MIRSWKHETYAVFLTGFAKVLFFTLLLTIDRSSKCWALSNLSAQRTGQAFLSLGLHFNRGITFSLFEAHGILSPAVALAGLAVLILACIRSRALRSLWGIIPLWAGAVSNMTDRLLYGHVVDWVHIGGSYINLADLWLCLGCLQICFHCFKVRRGGL